MRPPPCSTRRITESAVTDLPEPDSPTTATVSPRPDGEREVADGDDRALRSPELDRQAFDGEDGGRRRFHREGDYRIAPVLLD
jgi:hypothetical protein